MLPTYSIHIEYYSYLDYLLGTVVLDVDVGMYFYYNVVLLSVQYSIIAKNPSTIVRYKIL